VVEVPVSYYPRIGTVEDQRYAEGHGRRPLGHSQLDSALLCPALKSRDTTARVGPRQKFMKSLSETVVRSSGSDRVLVIMAKAPS